VTSSNVSFLNSGSLLHTIFPKSQCWCVDAECTFVLRIRQDSYYRIELPCESDEDREKLGEFREVLAQVLQYEKTPCPFTRGFEVQLPERTKTPPPRKRPQQPPEKAKKWIFDSTWMPDQGPRPVTPVLEGSDSGTASSNEEDVRSSNVTDRSEVVPELPEPLQNITPLKPKPQRMLSLSERAKKFQGMRSLTMPIGRGMDFSIVRKDLDQAEDIKLGRKESTDSTSMMSSTDSFHTAQPSPPTPYLDAEVDLSNPWEEELSPRVSRKDQRKRGRSRHRRQISETTVRAPSSDGSEASPPTPSRLHLGLSPMPRIGVHLSSAPSTPPLVSDTEEDCPPSLDVPTPRDNIRLKRLTGASQRRAFSPMPHPHNLFLPATPQGPRKQFTDAMMRKTMDLVLGPPHHLVTLMLRIAAKIKNGAFGFTTFRIRKPAKIPCSWDSSDDDDSGDSEDDFGIPLKNLERSRSRLRQRGDRGCSSGVD
jgi:hypothetical protein